MTATNKQVLSLNKITEVLNLHTALKARFILSDFLDYELTLNGEIEKIVRREGLHRLCVKTLANGRIMTAFCDFDTDVKSQLKTLKIKVGSTVELTGKFASAGGEAITVKNCELV